MNEAERTDVRFYTDNIRTFVAVAESGGIGRAARSLGISQPSVSQQVVRLEARLGAQLFRRTRTGVALTPDGAILLRHAQSLIEINGLIREQFGLDGRKVRLCLGLSEMFGLTSLHRLLWLVARQNPELALRVVLAGAETLARGLDDGAFDVVVASLTTAHADARLVRREPLAWIGRADCAMPIPDPIPLILPLAPSRLRTAMLGTLEAHGRTWTSAFELSSVSVAEAAIEAGFGCCAVLRRMPLHGPVHLDARSGLPDLPDLEYHLRRSDDGRNEVLSALCKLIDEAARHENGPA